MWRMWMMWMMWMQRPSKVNKLKAAAKVHLRHIRIYTTAKKKLKWQATKYDADEKWILRMLLLIMIIKMIITMVEERLRELVDQGKWQ